MIRFLTAVHVGLKIEKVRLIGVEFLISLELTTEDFSWCRYVTNKKTESENAMQRGAKTSLQTPQEIEEQWSRNLQ